MEKIVYLIIAVGLILLALGFQVATPSSNLNSSAGVSQTEDLSGDVNSVDQPVTPAPTVTTPSSDQMMDFNGTQTSNPPGLPY